MTIEKNMMQLGEAARQASRLMARASCGQKDQALHAIAVALQSSQQELLSANQQDLARAKENNLSAALLCLLYTSPSPRDLSTSRMPSSA